MRTVVRGYVHRAGLHCGSTAMRNVLAHRGIELSEPMCFGLGAGAGFFYVPELPVPPGVVFHGRTLMFERDLCGVLGLPFDEHTEDDADLGWTHARGAVLAGHPVLLATDLAYLDYFGTGTHFAGHRVVLVGVDDEAGEAILSDSEREGLQGIPVASLKRSRGSDIPPFPMRHWWTVVDPKSGPRPVSEAIPAAIRKNAREIFSPGEDGLSGIPALRRVAEEIARWPGMTDTWEFAARFQYQVIEKRGTGGGFFRRLYAAFLAEASTFYPVIGTEGFLAEITEAADGWTEIGLRFREISEAKDPALFAGMRDPLLRQAEREERFWRRAAAVAEGMPAGKEA